MKKDFIYLAKLQDYYRDHRVLPSYRTMTEVLGLASKSAVHALIARLIDEGFVSKTPDRRIAPSDRFFERPLAQSAVRAGMPSFVEDSVSDSMAVDHYLIDNPTHSLLVPVQGDSMINAGIHDGDIAIIDTMLRYKAGDIVIADIAGEVTLKTLVRDEGLWALKPENPDYPLIQPKDEWRVVGVLVGLMRKYR
jgi:repressor LexA